MEKDDVHKIGWTYDVIEPQDCLMQHARGPGNSPYDGRMEIESTFHRGWVRRGTRLGITTILLQAGGKVVADVCNMEGAIEHVKLECYLTRSRRLAAA